MEISSKGGYNLFVYNAIKMQKNKLNICITGSTSGIGLATVKALSERKDKAYNIFVTSRKLDNAQAAMEKLAFEVGDSPSTLNALELDLSKKESVDAFVANLVAHDIQFDVLDNNAGVNNMEEGKKSQEGFYFNWTTNYTNTRYLAEQMIEQGRIKENGKIIFVSSLTGKWQTIKNLNPGVYKRLKTSDEWGYKEINELEKECIEDHQDEERAKRWDWVYSSSKLFVNLFTLVFSKDPRVTQKGIQVYALCPGFCETSMMAGTPYQGKAPRTAEQGAQTPVYLIDLPFKIDPELQGGFFEREKLSSYDSVPKLMAK